jgi:hypothetical protein
MPSKNYLMLRSAQRARLEARTCRDAANFLTASKRGGAGAARIYQTSS